MIAAEYGIEVNLAELRCRLTSRLALLLMAASGLVAWRSLSWEPFLPAPFGLSVALLALGWGVRTLVKTHPALAQNLMAWGLVLGLIAAMLLFSSPWIPFLGLMLVFIAGMLTPAGGFITAGLVAGAAVWLKYTGVRDYPLPGLLAALATGVALAWLVVYTLYSALEWAWTMQQRANQLLEVSRDRQGELNRTLKSLDLTNTLLSRTQRELMAARRQADEARLVKEQFAANVSHELRTPLNLILGFSEMLYLSPEIYGGIQWSPRLRRAIYQIYRSSRHLLEMIDDVLNLSRFEMVGFTLNKEPTPLEPLLREAVEIAQDLFQGSPVSLQVEIEPGLPTLEVDCTRIRQVLLNLLNNAARFTTEGSVRLTARRGDGEVLISVSDTGPGIPAPELPRIFKEFYQVDRSLRRKHGGTGLGLAISKHFVEAHGGRIWVESQEGVGTTFTISLPIASGQHPLWSRPTEESQEPPHPAPSLPILVVDPDPTVADLVHRYLGKYDVVHVDDVARLADEVVLRHPRAVIRNVRPGQQVESPPISLGPVPYIECSLPSRAQVADDIAVAACLTKPVSVERLLREIERVGDVHTVLVADDDRGFCQLIAQMLEASGRPFDLGHAYDGAEALEAMRAHRPDLLILDLGMPGMDGLQVLAEMQRDKNLTDVPVLLLTASSYVEDALGRGGDRIILRRSEGLSTTQVLECLKAVVDALEPNYDGLLALGEPITPPPTGAARSERRPG